MDWNKLQHTLFNLDPVDPQAERERLKKIAQVHRSEAAEELNLVNESYNITPGSMPLGIDSVNDFAALAGIRLDEKKQKDADQVRGSEPMPKAKKGRTEHPFKDRLVGEADAPGSIAQAAKQGIQRGLDSPNWAQDKIQQKLGLDIGTKSAPAAPKQANSKLQPTRLAQLIPVDNPQHFVTALRKTQQAGDQPLSRNEVTSLADAFTKLLAMDPKETSRVMQALRQMQVSTAPSTNPAPQETIQRESIKERLYRELRSKSK
jgi:hypothetical protein